MNCLPLYFSASRTRAGGVLNGWLQEVRASVLVGLNFSTDPQVVTSLQVCISCSERTVLRVSLPKNQRASTQRWNLTDSDLDETWSAGSPGPNTTVGGHILVIQTRTVGPDGTLVVKFDFFQKHHFGQKCLSANARKSFILAFHWILAQKCPG